MFEFNLPDLGERIHEGEILKWYIAVGDTIEEDAPLVEVETDKAAVTIPSPRGGKVVSLAGEVGEIIETGSVVAVIDDGSEGVVAVEKTEDPVKKRKKRSIPANSAIPGRPVPAAPSTRRLARELGVDINNLKGTGPGGRVLPDDVKMSVDGDVVVLTPETNAASVASAIPFLDIEALPDYSLQGEVEVEPLRSIRRRVARKMTTSMILVPHVAHMDEADVTELEEFRKRVAPAHEKRGGGKLTLLSFVIRAVTAGLKEAPSFNASLDPLREELIYKKFYNIGFAADTGRGLVVPVINDTDKKSIGEISKDLQLKTFKLNSKDKVFYHLAGVIGSNFLAGNLYNSEELLSLCGIDKKDSFEKLKSTIFTTLENTRKFGAANALSGPIDRGDFKTMTKHITALKKLEKIKVPVFIIHGDNDLVVPISNAEIFKEKIKNSKMFTLKNCGHYSFIEKEDEVIFIGDSTPDGFLCLTSSLVIISFK